MCHQNISHCHRLHVSRLETIWKPHHATPACMMISKSTFSQILLLCLLCLHPGKDILCDCGIYYNVMGSESDCIELQLVRALDKKKRLAAWLLVTYGSRSGQTWPDPSRHTWKATGLPVTSFNQKLCGCGNWLLKLWQSPKRSRSSHATLETKQKNPLFDRGTIHHIASYICACRCLIANRQHVCLSCIVFARNAPRMAVWVFPGTK